MKQINEQTTVTLALAFTDLLGRKVVPLSGKYQIVDMGSPPSILKSWTNFIPGATTYNIVIVAEYNRILDPAHDSEIRAITVVMQYSDSGQATAEFMYEVINIFSLPPTLEVIVDGGYIIGGDAGIVGNNV